MAISIGPRAGKLLGKSKASCSNILIIAGKLLKQSKGHRLTSFSQALTILTMTSTQTLPVQVHGHEVHSFQVSAHRRLRKSLYCTQAWQHSNHMAALGSAAATAVSKSVSAHSVSHDNPSCPAGPSLICLAMQCARAAGARRRLAQSPGQSPPLGVNGPNGAGHRQ